MFGSVRSVDRALEVWVVDGMVMPRQLNSEQNRNVRRDKKRRTRMVVDNGGVKRIVLARAFAAGIKQALRREHASK